VDTTTTAMTVDVNAKKGTFRLQLQIIFFPAH